MNPWWQALVNRVPARFTELRQDIRAAFQIVNRLETIDKDRSLSETDRRQLLREEAEGQWEHFTQLTKSARAAVTSIEAQRKAQQPTDPNCPALREFDERLKAVDAMVSAVEAASMQLDKAADPYWRAN